MRVAVTAHLLIICCSYVYGMCVRILQNVYVRVCVHVVCTEWCVCLVSLGVRPVFVLSWLAFCLMWPVWWSVRYCPETSNLIVLVRYCLLQLCAMRSSSLLLLSILVGVCDVEGASDFKICAFNLHSFGDSKSKKDNVMHTLVRVRQRQMNLAETLWYLTWTSVGKCFYLFPFGLQPSNCVIIKYIWGINNNQ